MTMVQQASKQIAERNGCKCKKIPNSTYMEIHIVHQSINRNNCHIKKFPKLFIFSERKLPDKN
jgi:ferritin-like protein